MAQGVIYLTGLVVCITVRSWVDNQPQPDCRISSAPRALSLRDEPRIIGNPLFVQAKRFKPNPCGIALGRCRAFGWVAVKNNRRQPRNALVPELQCRRSGWIDRESTVD